MCTLSIVTTFTNIEAEYSTSCTLLIGMHYAKASKPFMTIYISQKNLIDQQKIHRNGAGKDNERGDLGLSDLVRKSYNQEDFFSPIQRLSDLAIRGMLKKRIWQSEES